MFVRGKPGKLAERVEMEKRGDKVHRIERKEETKGQRPTFAGRVKQGSVRIVVEQFVPTPNRPYYTPVILCG